MRRDSWARHLFKGMWSVAGGWALELVVYATSLALWLISWPLMYAHHLRRHSRKG